ncbi:curli production assembly/transport component CsgF [Croceiramulus getboli]|nr:curli assembly protein CsgF [Flavobacteriaceae bacterium YJPT1-3]
MKKLIFILLLMGSSLSFAQQFSYTPINPAFGGSNFNYSWMLQSATAQNGLTADTDGEEQSDLEEIGEQLNRQILNQISRTLLNQQIEALGDFTEEGTFTFGDLAVEVVQTDEGLVINILDTTNGEQTQIVVPN